MLKNFLSVQRVWVSLFLNLTLIFNFSLFFYEYFTRCFFLFNDDNDDEIFSEDKALLKNCCKTR